MIQIKPKHQVTTRHKSRTEGKLNEIFKETLNTTPVAELDELRQNVAEKIKKTTGKRRY